MAATRPLTLGEILDRTIQLFRGNFLLFAGIAFFPSAIEVVISGSSSLFFSSRMPVMPQPGQPPNMQFLLSFVLFAAAFVLIGVPLLLGTISLALAALNYAAMQRNRGEVVTIRAAYAYGFRHFWRFVGIFFLQVLFAGILPGIAASILLFGGAMIAAAIAVGGASPGPATSILIGLLIFLFFIAVAVVCVLIWLRFCLAFPVSVTEEKKVWPSLMRSNQIGKGTRGRIFVMYLLVFIMVLVVYYTLTLPVDLVLKLTLYKSTAGIEFITRPPFALLVFALCVNCLERTIAMPIYAIALLFFFNDQRVRHEGYDIELLMDQAGWSQFPSLPPSPPPVLPPAPPSVSTEVLPLPAEAASVQAEIPPAENPPANPSPEGAGA